MNKLEEREKESQAMELMDKGCSPSEVDALLALRDGETHDMVVRRWRKDKAAASEVRRMKGGR